MGLMDFFSNLVSPMQGPPQAPMQGPPQASTGLSWENDFGRIAGGAGLALSQMAAGQPANIMGYVQRERAYADKKAADAKYDAYLEGLDSYAEKAKKSGSTEGGKAIETFATGQKAQRQARDSLDYEINAFQRAFSPISEDRFNQAAGIKKRAEMQGPPVAFTGLPDNFPDITSGRSLTERPSAAGETSVTPVPDGPPQREDPAATLGGLFGQSAAQPSMQGPPVAPELGPMQGPPVAPPLGPMQGPPMAPRQIHPGIGNPLDPRAPGDGVIGGNTFGGNKFGGNTFGGNTFGGNKFGGNQFGPPARPIQGPPVAPGQIGGNKFGGNKFGGNQFGGQKFGGNTYGASAEKNIMDEAANTGVEAEQAVASVAAANNVMDRHNVSPQIRRHVLDAAEKHGVPPGILASLIAQESSFNATAEGPDTGKYGTAKGLMQFIDSTAAGEGLEPTDVYDPSKAIDAGAGYLRKLKDKFGNWDDALKAYNWGEGNLARAKARGSDKLPEETDNYYKKIMKNAGMTPADEMEISASTGDEAGEVKLGEAESKAVKSMGLGPRAQGALTKTPAFQEKVPPPPAEGEEENDFGPTLGAARLMEAEHARAAAMAGGTAAPLFTKDQLKLAKALGREKGGAMLAQIAMKEPSSPWQLFNAGDGNIYAVNKYNPQQALRVAGTGGGQADAASTMGKEIQDMGGDPADPVWQRRWLEREKEKRRAASANPLPERYKKHGLVQPDKGYEWAWDAETNSPAMNKEGRTFQQPIPGGPEDPSIKNAARNRKRREENENMLLSLQQARNILDSNLKAGIALPASGFLSEYIAKVGGTQAADLDAKLNTAKALIGFTKLQEMREASPTGGALGQVSNFENHLLQAVRGNLSQNQSPQQLMDTMDRLIAEQNRIIYGHENGFGAFRREQAKQEQFYKANNTPQDQRFRINYIDDDLGLRFKGGDPSVVTNWEDISSPSAWIAEQQRKLDASRRKK